MFIDRKIKVDTIIKKILSNDLDNIENLFEDLYDSYDLHELDPNTIYSLSALFDFPIDKIIDVCIHNDAIVLSYDTPYTIDDKPIKAQRMFFFWDHDNLQILPDLLVYLRCRLHKCPDCQKAQKAQKAQKTQNSQL